MLLLHATQAQNTKSLGISIEPSLEKAMYWTKSKDFATPASFGLRIGLSYQVNTQKFSYSVGVNYSDRNLKHQLNNLIFGSDIRGGTTSSMKSSTQLKEIGVIGLVQRKIKDNINATWQPVLGGGVELNKVLYAANHSWIALGSGGIDGVFLSSSYTFPSLNVSLLAAQGIAVKLNQKQHLEFDLLERMTLVPSYFDVRRIKTSHFSIGFNVCYFFALNSW